MPRRRNSRCTFVSSVAKVDTSAPRDVDEADEPLLVVGADLAERSSENLVVAPLRRSFPSPCKQVLQLCRLELAVRPGFVERPGREHGVDVAHRLGRACRVVEICAGDQGKQSQRVDFIADQLEVLAGGDDR